MAFETEYANFVNRTDEISAGMSPAFVNASIGANLVYAENFPAAGPKVLKFRKSGSLVAETLAESTAYTFSANSEMTDSSISCTAVKGVVVTKLTLEAFQLAGPDASVQRIADEQGRSLARLFDATLLALFDGLSQAVTASTTLTASDLLDAQYTVFSGKTPPGRLVAVLDYKGVNELGKQAINTSAAAFTQPGFLNLIGTPQANNFKGELAGIDIYQTSGLSTTGSDDQGAVFHPLYAFCAGLGGAFETYMSPIKISEGFYWEIGSVLWFDIKEWNDLAGTELRSDT